MNFYEHTIIARQDISPAQLKQVEDKYKNLEEAVRGSQTEIKKTALDKTELEARISSVEKSAKYASDPEAFKTEIEKMRAGVNESVKISARNAEKISNWYTTNATKIIKDKKKNTLGDVLDAMQKSSMSKLTASVRGSAKEKLAAKIMNEIMSEQMELMRETPIQASGLNYSQAKKADLPTLESAGLAQAEQSRINQALERRERFKSEIAAKRSLIPAMEKVIQRTADKYATVKNGKIVKQKSDLTNRLATDIFRGIAENIKGNTRSKEHTRQLLKDAAGHVSAMNLYRRRTDLLNGQLREIYSIGRDIETANEEAKQAIKDALAQNLGHLIHHRLSDYVVPRKVDRTIRTASRRELPHTTGKYDNLVNFSDSYNRLAREYSSSKELESDKDKIKQETKKGLQRKLDLWVEHSRKNIKEERDKVLKNTQHGTLAHKLEVITALKKVAVDTGLSNISGANKQVKNRPTITEQLNLLEAKIQDNALAFESSYKEYEDYKKAQVAAFDAEEQALSTSKAQVKLLEEKLADLEDSHSRQKIGSARGNFSKRGARVAEFQREALREMIDKLKGQATSLTQAPAPQPPARQQLLDTVDQTAEESAVRMTPRPSEDLLTNYSREPSAAELATLYDRSRFLTAAKENTTKTGLRSKFQRQVDDELVLIHKRLDILAAQRFGSAAPRVPNSERYLQHFKTSAKDPESRKRLRTKLKGEIKKLYEAVKQ